MTQLHDLQKRIGAINEKSGFHGYADTPDEHKNLYTGNKLMLVASELAEAQDELRTGHAPTETYYIPAPLPDSLVWEVGPEKARTLIDADNEGKLKKPEGFPSEIADAVIRLLDVAEELGIDLEAIIEEKLLYNASRPFKHGKKF